MVVNARVSTRGKPSKGGGRVPVYQRIQQHFRDLIAAGGLEAGDQLPTELEIAETFGTSRATVQTAMSRLVHEGWIEKHAGRGTFVADTAHSARIDLDHVRAFEDDVASHGDRVIYRLLNVGRVAAPSHVADHLGVESGTTLFSFERLRLVGDAIIGMETRYFAPEITLDFSLDLLDTESTHHLVRHYLNMSIGRMEVSIHACAADEDIAKKLGTEPGSPMLLRRHTMFTVDDQHILYGEAFYREPFAFRYVAHSHEE